MNKSEIFSKSFSLKPYAYLFKPIDIDQIRAAIEVANYQRNLEITNERIISELKKEIEQRKKVEKERSLRLQERIRAEHKVNQLIKQKHHMELDLINRELATSSIFISQKNWWRSPRRMGSSWSGCTFQWRMSRAIPSLPNGNAGRSCFRAK